MRINPNGNSLPPQSRRLDSKSTPPGGNASPASTAVSATAIQLDSIRELSQVLEQSVEVRESVVEAVKLKIQAGEYLTKAAAAEAARSILEL